MVFVAKLLDSLNQGVFEFDQSREIGVEVWGLLDVLENGGKRVGKKDGCYCPHDCTSISVFWLHRFEVFRVRAMQPPAPLGVCGEAG